MSENGAEPAPETLEKTGKEGEETSDMVNTSEIDEQEQQSANEFDDDDFGDFEEAGTAESEDIPQDSNKEEEETTAIDNRRPSIATVDVPALSEIIDTDLLWIMDQIQELSNIETLNDLQFYLSQDKCDNNHECTSSSLLWESLNIVEETNALQFKWQLSNHNKQFLNSIEIRKPNLNSQQQYHQKSPGNGFICQSSSSLTYAENPLMPDLTNLNSLQVDEPACFDWNQAGLSNPLTRSNPDTTPQLDCDFFQTSSITSSKTNGKALLDQDLDAWGLSDMKTSSNPHQNGQKSVSNNNTQDPLKFLSVSDLNTHAQSFYDKMPDLSFMLADRVIWPSTARSS